MPERYPKLYARGEASKGDIVEHVADSDDELRSCDQGKAILASVR